MKKLLYKVLGTAYTWLAMHYRQWQTYCFSVLHPYHYDPERYKDTFLESPCEFLYTDDFSRPVDRVIYIFWTGENEITPNRMKGIESMKKVCGVEVKLITPKNLPEYIKDEDPLPEAYKYLSFVHDAYIMGYPEVGFWGAAYHDIDESFLRNELWTHWRYLVGNGSYICRPHTRLTAEWHTEAKRRLIDMTEVLRSHPAQDPFGRNVDYPVKWSGLLGSIFHPLCLKYKDRLLSDKALMPSFENYR